jgi:predicted DNA-binding transcriptional regulator YafY
MKDQLRSFAIKRIIIHSLAKKEMLTFSDLLLACKNLPEADLIDKDAIERAIEELKKPEPDGYHAPIVYDQRKDGFYYSDRSFSMDKTPLNQQEKEWLMFANQIFDQLKDHESLKGLAPAIQKINNTLKIRSFTGDKGIPEFVQPELSSGFGGNQFLDPLIKAIQKRSVIRVYYHPFYEDKPYFTIIHPYLLKEYRNRWYLIGLNDTKQEIRTYGLDRIWELHEIEQEYIPRKFSARDYFRNSVGIISLMTEPPEIRLSVLRHQAQYLITQPIHETQFIEIEDDERVIFHFKVHPTYEFKSLILAMGPDARIISPESLKREMIKLLNETLLEYAKGENK